MGLSTEHFIHLLMTNPELRTRLEAAPDSSEVRRLALEAGLDPADVQLEMLMKALADGPRDLGESELASMAGGGAEKIPIPDYSLLHTDFNSHNSQINIGP